MTRGVDAQPGRTWLDVVDFGPIWAVLIWAVLILAVLVLAFGGAILREVADVVQLVPAVVRSVLR